MKRILFTLIIFLFLCSISEALIDVSGMIADRDDVLDVALIVGDSSSWDGQTDYQISSILTGEGHSVTRIDDNDIADDSFDALYTNYDVIVVSESVSSGNMAGAKDYAIGIFNNEPYCMDEWAIGDTATVTVGNTDDEFDMLVNHFITQESGTGTEDISDDSPPDELMPFGTFQGEHTVIANSADDATEHQIAIWEKNALDNDSNTIEGRRCYWGIDQWEINTAGEDIFYRCFIWTASQDNNPYYHDAL